MRFGEPIVGRFDEIKTAKRVKKTWQNGINFNRIGSFRNRAENTGVIRITRQRIPMARDGQLPYPTSGKGQSWFPNSTEGGM